jgi:spermidine synthase
MMLTTRDNFLYHEMMSHPALFTHAAPRDVVIIGGGGFGFREADARGKTFATRYYSADLHRGALATPPFVAEALE